MDASTSATNATDANANATDASTSARTKKKRRRVRSPHPGVKLKKRALPGGGISWRAHYIDPETGREKAETLDAALSTKEARTTWAKQKSAELAIARIEAAKAKPAEPSGPEPLPIETAIAEYEATARHRLRKNTLSSYALAFGFLRAWSTEAKIETLAQLTPAALGSLRDYLIRLPKRSSAKGAGRGGKKAIEALRSPVSTNQAFRSLKALFNDWRTRGLLPALHRDDISDALKALPINRDDPPFLRPAQLRALLAAALRHDAATYAETRDEHAGKRARGSTKRYEPIAPFLVFLLLTGMRRGEALALEWRMIDLDALDHEGRTVGEIRLPSEIIKTKKARTVGLEVSPALRTLLAAMKLRNPKTTRVFGYSETLVQAARKRLLQDFGAPAFDWQALRSTCATYLTNAPGIFGAATVFMSAKQLGHSVVVAEKHYLGVHRGIPRNARTLEAAMQIEKDLARVLAARSAPAAAPRATKRTKRSKR